jgi:hypothetical protein
MTETAGESRGAVRETMGQALEKGKDTAQQGVDKAKEAAGQARGAVSQQFDERSTMVGERANGLAQMARRVAGELRGEGDEQTAKLTEAAADRAERLGAYLRDSDGDKFLRDIEDFARRRPMVAATAGFLIGMVASRFVKASAERRAFSTNGDVENERRYGTERAVPQTYFGHEETGQYVGRAEAGF